MSKNKQKRILVSGLSMNFLSGQPLFCFELCKEFKRQGHEVTMFSEWKEGLKGAEGYKLKENLKKAGIKRLNWGEESRLKPEDYDLIIANEPISERVLNTLPTVPAVNIINSEYGFEKPISNRDQIIKYVCIRPSIKKHLVEKCGIPKEKCSVIYNGIDRERFKPREKSKRDYYKIVIPCTTDPLREKFLTHLINSANEKRQIHIFGVPCLAHNTIPRNEWTFFHPDKFNIEEDIADADEVSGILFGRVNIEALSCGVKTSWYNPDTLERFEMKEYPNFDYHFNIKNTVKRLLALFEPPSISIVIPHHDRHDHLYNLLKNFDKFHNKYKYSIVSGSSFGENCNKGFKNVDTDWVLFLNDDVEIEDETLFVNLTLTDGDIVGSLLKPSVSGIRFNEQGRWRPCYINDGTTPQYPSGACLAIKSAVFKELGGFDETFINGNEDLDFFLKAEEKGYRIRIIPDVIKHLENQSKGRMEHCGENIKEFNKRWKPKGYWMDD